MGGEVACKPNHLHGIGGAEGAHGRLRASRPAPHGTSRAEWRIFCSQKCGARPHVPLHGPRFAKARSQLPHSGSPEKPLHALLLLHPRRGNGADGPMVMRMASFFPLQATHSLNGPRYREGIELREGDLPQERQRVSVRLQPAAAASSLRTVHRRSNPQTARLHWTLLLGSKFSKAGAGGHKPAAIQCR
jgi:hypothetical protein